MSVHHNIDDGNLGGTAINSSHVLLLTHGTFIMGRDPVEYAKRAKYQPPAMRVRGVCYTKKSPFRYNFGCSSLNYNEGKGDFNGQ